MFKHSSEGYTDITNVEPATNAYIDRAQDAQCPNFPQRRGFVIMLLFFY